MKRYFATAILLLLAVIVCPAQQRIVKIMDAMERKSNVNSTYTERRDNKHQLYRTTRVLKFNEKDFYKQLVDAFEAERNNTSRAVKNNGTYTFKFEDNKGTYTFTLTKNTIVMSWRSSTITDDDASTSTITINGVEMRIPDDSYFATDDYDKLLHEFGSQKQAFEALKHAFDVQKEAFKLQKEAFEAQKKAAKEGKTSYTYTYSYSM